MTDKETRDFLREELKQSETKSKTINEENLEKAVDKILEFSRENGVKPEEVLALTKGGKVFTRKQKFYKFLQFLITIEIFSVIVLAIKQREFLSSSILIGALLLLKSNISLIVTVNELRFLAVFQGKQIDFLLNEIKPKEPKKRGRKPKIKSEEK